MDMALLYNMSIMVGILKKNNREKGIYFRYHMVKIISRQ